VMTDEEAADVAKDIFNLFCEATNLADLPVGFAPRRQER
jgi:hypothetical protein